jgi:hypothetical protein
LSNQGQAYVSNQSNTFQYVDFKDVPASLHGYQGRFRGLVADSSISPANSGVFINGSFISGSNTGVKIDYLNGRVIVPSGSGTGLTITANNTIKEVNIYPYDDDEAQLVISSDFVDYNSQTSTFLSSLVNQLDQKTYLLPACFLRYVTTENENAGFGGEKDSKTRIRAVVIAKDNYIIDGVLSLFGDTKGFCVNIIPYEDYPYGKYNTIKSFPYSYSSYITNYQTKAYIEDVTTSKLDYSIAMDKLEKNILVGFIDFDLSTFRQPV